MSDSDKTPEKQNILIAVMRGFTHWLPGLFNGFLLPVGKDLWQVSCAMCRPVAQAVTRTLVTTLHNLHGKKHWLHRFSGTFWGNATGLAIAMMSAQVVSQFIEVRGAGNLWGLFSKRTLVSESGYQLVSFVVEFLVTLIVFSVVEYLMDQHARKKQDITERDDDYEL